MRKVMVIQNFYSDGKWELVDRGEAVFHSFGLDYEESSDGLMCGFSTVEWHKLYGKVEMVRADRVRFLSDV